MSAQRMLSSNEGPVIQKGPLSFRYNMSTRYCLWWSLWQTITILKDFLSLLNIIWAQHDHVSYCYHFKSVVGVVNLSHLIVFSETTGQLEPNLIVPFQNYIRKPIPSSNMAAVTKNKNVIKWETPSNAADRLEAPERLWFELIFDCCFNVKLAIFTLFHGAITLWYQCNDNIPALN